MDKESRWTGSTSSLRFAALPARTKGARSGSKRFADVTGIRETDWLGKHWARWSDAVREAGLEPNSLQDAFDEDTLLEQYAQLVRALGHVPVKAELQMQHRRDPSFPDINAFIRGFVT